MSDSPLDHPEIKALLQEADAMSRVLRDLGEDESGNFAAALEQIYADLGRAIHKMLPSENAFDDDETTAVTGRLAEAMADLAEAPRKTKPNAPLLPDDEDEVEVTDPGIPKPSHPPSDTATPLSLGARSRRAKTPAPKAPTRREARQKRAEERHAAVVATMEREGTPTAAEPRAATPGDASFGRVAVHIQRDVGSTDWIERLADLLELIALPTDLTAPSDLAAEASLVQWSTSDLDTTWAPFPPAIKAALLGLLASRARHLQDQLSVDVGPRIALERLSAYRERTGLAKVEGLYPERKAQSGTWQTDAARWWDTLVEGLREV